MGKFSRSFGGALVVSCLLASPADAAPAVCTGGIVALTFDDGPVPETEAILDALKLHGLRATFFVLGANVQAYPQIAQRIAREGHQIANHSWDHPDLALLTPEEVDWQIRATNEIIRQVTGIVPRFARPPYGSTNATVRQIIANNRLAETIWSQDSWDWAGALPSDILNQLTLVPPGGVFVMHDWAPNSLLAIPGFQWYFKTYWKSTPICSGRLQATTNVQPVLDWLGLFYSVRAVTW
ncbi:MAG: polysaccharide deacetylase family protein [Vicinamibacterales bacterium]